MDVKLLAVVAVLVVMIYAPPAQGMGSFSGLLFYVASDFV